MRSRTALAAMLAATLAAGGAGVALAQPAPPPAAAEGPGTPPPPRPERGGPGPHARDHMMGMWGPEHGPGAEHGPDRPGMQGMGMHGMGMGLFYTPADRQLTAADVQTIAQAFLLWHGNHSWKVVDVKEIDANTIGFAYATPNGDVVARFTMDRHTGRPQRVG